MTELEKEPYSQHKTGDVFDWNAFLASTDHDTDAWNEAYEYSGSWVTCACGNQCAVLPRDSEGEPCDKLLSKLGFDFHTAIGDEDALQARAILAAIERRSAYLLKLPTYTDPA